MTDTTEIVYAERVADTQALVRAVRDTVLTKHTARIGPKTYVCVAGGTAIANAMGLTVRESACRFVDPTNHMPGHWEAEAEVVNSDGVVVGRGTGRVFMDESRWANGPKFAAAAMAGTRAAARALRYVLGHIYVAMDVADTPYEEMSAVRGDVATPALPPPAPTASSARPARQQAPPQSGATLSADVTITAVEVGKTGTRNGRDWRRYDVTTAELGVLRTFSDSIADEATAIAAAGGRATVTYEEGKFGLDLKSLAPLATQVETQASVDDDDDVPF